jgi:type VI secretion system secreted protein VgrG
MPAFDPPNADSALSSLLSSFASPFGQHARLLRLRFGDDSGLPPDLLLPHKLDGEERLSACYRYELECLCSDMHLELKELLGQPVEIGLLLADGDERLLAGLVTAARHLGGDGGFARYNLTIEPALATLVHRLNSRVFQDLSVPDIVQAVLNEHLAANPVFAQSFSVDVELTGTYPARSYCLQYRESDLAFITRLLAEEGISYRFSFGESEEEEDSDSSERSATPHHALILFDDASQLEAHGQATVRFHRADGTEGEDTITDWQATRQVTAGLSSLQSWDYQPTVAHAGNVESSIRQGEQGDVLMSTLERYDPQAPYYGANPDELTRYATLRQQAADLTAKSFSGQGVVRGMTVGRWFKLRDHPLHDHDAQEERQFLVTALRFTAENNILGEPSADAGKSTLPYTNSFTAVRRGIPVVPLFNSTEHAKPTARGPQTATVVGPSGEEVFTDEHGRIKVQFHWQRQQDHADGGAAFDERSSTWVRVAYPSAGAGWGTQHIPRIGQEILIEFLENDIDRPLCTKVIHNGTHPTPTFSGAGSLPANKTLSGTKTKEHHGNGYNELLFDDTTNELRTKLSSEHAKTQLNQGYLIHPRTDGKGTPRGEGFELRTDAVGAIRAAKGLLLSAEVQAGAAGKQLERQVLLQILDTCADLAETLGEQAQHQHANLPETGKDDQLIQDDAVPGTTSTKGHQTHLRQALHNLERGSNTDKNNQTGTGSQPGGQSVIAITAPDGVAVTTSSSTTIAAGTNLDQVALRDSSQTTGRRWIHNVADSISLFVAGTKAKVKDTFKLIAAKGNIQLQAQDGQIEATAQQDITITSVGGKLVIQAPKEILLTAGGGYIRIGKDIEIHNPGQQSQKAANFALSGPASMSAELPHLPKAENKDNWIEINHHYDDLEPMKGAPYKLIFEDGSQLSGKLDGNGFARHEGVPKGRVTVKLEDDQRSWKAKDEHKNPHEGTASSRDAALEMIKKMAGKK